MEFFAKKLRIRLLKNYQKVFNYVYLNLSFFSSLDFDVKINKFKIYI